MDSDKSIDYGLDRMESPMQVESTLGGIADGLSRIELDPLEKERKKQALKNQIKRNSRLSKTLQPPKSSNTPELTQSKDRMDFNNGLEGTPITKERLNRSLYSNKPKARNRSSVLGSSSFLQDNLAEQNSFIEMNQSVTSNGSRASSVVSSRNNNLGSEKRSSPGSVASSGRLGPSFESSKFSQAAILLVNNLHEELKKEAFRLEAITNPDWSAYIKVYDLLGQIEQSQSDTTFVHKPLPNNFTSRFQFLKHQLDSLHQEQLVYERNISSYQQQFDYVMERDDGDEIAHLDPEMRGLVKEGGVPAFLLPKYQYPDRVDVHKLEVMRDDVAGWNLIAGEDIRMGDKIFQIPRHLIISSMAASLSKEFCDMIRGLESMFINNGMLRLTMYLFYHRTLGVRSQFYDHINLFPFEVSIPFTYDPEVLKPYTATYFIGDVIDQFLTAVRHYHKIRQGLQQNGSGLYKKFTWMAFKWCYSIVLSRAVQLPLPTPPLGEFKAVASEWGIVPIADLCNFSDKGGCAVYNPKTSCYELVAKGLVVANEEPISLRYPLFSNRELMLRYGFCHPTKLAFDTIRLPLQILADNDQALPLRQFACLLLGIPTYKTFQLSPPPIHSKGRDLLKFLVLKNLTSHELLELCQVTGAALNPKYQDQKSRQAANKILDKLIGPEHSQPDEPISPHLKKALNHLFIDLQVHTKYNLGDTDPDHTLSLLPPDKETSYPHRWVAGMVKLERKLVNDQLEYIQQLINVISPFD